MKINKKLKQIVDSDGCFELNELQQAGVELEQMSNISKKQYFFFLNKIKNR